MRPDKDQMVDELYRVFMLPPEGYSSDEKPFIEDLRLIVSAYKRGSWLARVLVWLVPTVALLLASADAISTYIGGSSR